MKTSDIFYVKETNKKKSNYIYFKIRDGFDVAPIKIRANQTLRRAIRCFCRDIGHPLITMRFLYKDRLIQPSATPQEIGLKDGDTIYACCLLYIA